MSVIARRKEGRTGAGYFGYFSRPQQAIRTLIAFVVEVARERVAAWRQVRHDVRAPRAPELESTPCCARSRRSSAETFACSASSTTCARGAPRSTSTCSATTRSRTTRVPSGPTRSRVLRDIDRQVGRIERAMRFAPRPYRLVVLSDHGQTQGAPFADRAGETARRPRRSAVRRGGLGRPRRRGRPHRVERVAAAGADGDEPPPATSVADARAPIVLGSGSLGADLAAGLGLAAHAGGDRPPATRRCSPASPRHPEIGFVLVATASGRSVVLGRSGSATW